MNFNEKVILEFLEKLSKKEVSNEFVYEKIKTYIKNTLIENKFEVNHLNISYLFHLIKDKIFCTENDYGYDEKLNSTKFHHITKELNFSIDEIICRSLSVFLIDIDELSSDVLIKSEAKLLRNYLLSLDYFKKNIDIIE